MIIKLIIPITINNGLQIAFRGVQNYVDLVEQFHLKRSNNRTLKAFNLL